MARVRFLDQVPVGFYDVNNSNGGTPGGPSNSIQYNDGGTFNGDINLRWDNNTDTVLLTGSIIATSFTGSLFGTSSFALSSSQAQTASYVLSASYALSSSQAQTASYVVTAQTASYVLNAVSASYALSASQAQTASYVLNAVSASYALSASQAQTASYVVTAQTASYVLNAVSASYALSSSQAATASYVLNAVSSSYALSSSQAATASYVLSASYALSSSQAATASYVVTAQTASYVLNAVSSSQAQTASYVNPLNQDVIITGSLINGLDNIASQGSHAEGLSTIASGIASHAEGGGNTAYGQYSHAEGLNTIAYGFTSHTEGLNTIASGSYSHAEGFGTITSASYQHAQGMYNIISSISGAFILGNGTNNANRSNLIFAAGSEVQITGSLNVTNTLLLDGNLMDSSLITPTIAGSNILFTQATGSYTSAHGRYTVYKGANSRAGEFVTAWNGTTTSYYDNSTADIGNTTDVSFTSSIVTGQIQINAGTITSGWTVKMLVTYL